MDKKVIIIGASGHGHVIADIVRANNDVLIGFLDDDPNKNSLGPVSDYEKYKDYEFVIGIGYADIRERISSIPVKWYTAIHPSAIVSSSATIGEGTVIMPNVVINANTKIGKHCIINTASIIEHDNNIGDFCHISPGVNLGGVTTLGRKTWIGIGSIVNNRINICGNCIIGSGAVVVNDITQEGTYVGIPAKKILNKLSF